MLEKLYARRRFGIKPGLERIRMLLDRLGNPERAFTTIHVAGTNGKGSTAAFLSSILLADGKRTALFTSPHLVDFSERFRINGRNADDANLAALLKQVLQAAPEETTFFEIITGLSALLFAESGVEIAVMEAGMGGRSDSTAALPGIMTLLTPISLDHCDYLGSSVAEIAAEKAAIAEAGTIMISARQEQTGLQAIMAHCNDKNIRCHLAGTAFSAGWSRNGKLDYHGIGIELTDLEPGIPGGYQAENASMALAAAELLAETGFHISSPAMRQGIFSASWPGRMELIGSNPALMLDGAHNPAGSAALADALRNSCYDRILLVTGIMADKSAREILAPLAGIISRAYCVTPSIDRAMPDSQLAGIAASLGMDARPCGSVSAGIETARWEAAAGDLILVCGSLFTVGEAKACLAGKKFQGIRG